MAHLLYLEHRIILQIKEQQLKQSRVKMYETLSGKRRTIQQIQTDNMLCQLQYQISRNSYGIAPVKVSGKKYPPAYSLKRLKNMLTFKNLRYNYDNKPKIPTQWDFQLSYLINGPNAREPSLPKLMDKKIKNDRQTFIEHDKSIHQWAEQFCKLSLDDQLKFQTPDDTGSTSNNMVKFAEGLHQVNIQEHNKQKMAQNNNIEQMAEKSTGLKLLRYCTMATPYFLQLVRQVEIVKQAQLHSKGQLQIIFDILEGLGTVIDQQQIHKQVIKTYKVGCLEDKWGKIYWLFLLQKPMHRQELPKLLYDLDELDTFKIITSYDKLIKGGEIISLQQLQDYFNKVQSWLSLQAHKYNDYCIQLAQLLNFRMINSARNNNQMSTRYNQLTMKTTNRIIIQGWKIWRWKQIALSNQKQTAIFQQEILNSIKKVVQNIENILSNGSQNQNSQENIIGLKLMNYSKSFPISIINPNQKICLLLFICCEELWFNKLFQISNKISLGMGQKLATNDFREELYQQLKTNMADPIFCNFIIDCGIYLQLQNATQLLLRSKPMVQAIDWNYVSTIYSKKQVQFLLSSIIPKSINLYRNTSTFLNTGIPIQSFLPQFQIQILVLGLRVILTQGCMLNEKDKSKFFGMISIYRGENLSPQTQFLMVLLEMMFQIYVMKNAIHESDYKSLGLSLKSNLEQNDIQEGMVSTFSASLSQSTRINSISRIHNYEYIRKIGDSVFLTKIHTKYREFEDLYIIYLLTLIQSICKIRQCRQKMIRKSRIALWSEQLLRKVRQSLNSSQNDLFKKLRAVQDRVSALIYLQKI